MPNRFKDWIEQAKRDLEQAEESRHSGKHEWACFAAQQGAEKAVKAFISHPDIQTVILKVLLLNITDQFKARRRSNMPVKSLNLSILKWPDKQVIEKALQKWIKSIFPKKIKNYTSGLFWFLCKRGLGCWKRSGSLDCS